MTNPADSIPFQIRWHDHLLNCESISQSETYHDTQYCAKARSKSPKLRAEAAEHHKKRDEIRAKRLVAEEEFYQFVRGCFERATRGPHDGEPDRVPGFPGDGDIQPAAAPGGGAPQEHPCG